MENNSQNGEIEDWGSGEDNQRIERHPAYRSDRYFYRVIALSLSVVVILSMVGSLWLAYLIKIYLKLLLLLAPLPSELWQEY